ncbi:response regulator transcription factor [Bradyrhizobium canariense]|uniref:Regulatory protein, luxR family n=1 Tax=Bradyrhizobium canariense TaxID=255045 RepID=A0A1H1YN73_9BRAD|nr:LuxR C-terminal-related transcriptional regulator [Bradyrhizobium canariense]SDT22908.1 regulatory protein, luxR family [Bradyrhizobium canariense]
MSQYENRGGDSQRPTWLENGPSLEVGHEVARLAEIGARQDGEAGATIARELDGSLTALLIYMRELRDHSHEFAQAAGDRAYLKQVVENAFQQIERVCALVKRIEGAQEGSVVAPDCKRGCEASTVRAGRAIFSLAPGQKPLTKRECEVLGLISEGHSNKQGALRMGISPRTFESHRAEAMRKLGARNTADLVRKALLLRDTM